MADLFTTPEHLHSRNIIASAETHARPVIITGPHGQEPGVGLFRDKHLLGILTETDGARVAHEITRTIRKMT